MNYAKLIKEIMVLDPDTNNEVEVAIYKHENGGIMALDLSYLMQNFDDNSYPVVPDPFSANHRKPETVMLVD